MGHLRISNYNHTLKNSFNLVLNNADKKKFLKITLMKIVQNTLFLGNKWNKI